MSFFEKLCELMLFSRDKARKLPERIELYFSIYNNILDILYISQKQGIKMYE